MSRAALNILALLMYAAGVESVFYNASDPLVPAGPNCKVIEVPQDTTVLRVGGRVDMNCPGNDFQWSIYNSACYCMLTWQFDLWWWWTFLGFLAGLVISVRFLFVMKDAEKDKKMKFNPNFIIIALNITCLIDRLIYCIAMYNGRSYPHFFAELTNYTDNQVLAIDVFLNFLLKYAQISILAEMLLMILVWKSVVDATQKMKAISADADTKNYRYVGGLIAFLYCTVLPCTIVSGLVPSLKILGLVSNFIFLIPTLGLSIGGFFYARSLSKLLSTGSKDIKKQAAIRNIMVTVYWCIICALVTLLAIVINFLVVKNYSAAISEYLLWGWFVVHTTELVIFIVLAYGVSHKARVSVHSIQLSNVASSSASKSGASETEDNTSTTSEKETNRKS